MQKLTPTIPNPEIININPMYSGGFPHTYWYIYESIMSVSTPTKRSDAQPLVEREKQFECLPVEISRS